MFDGILDSFVENLCFGLSKITTTKGFVVSFAVDMPIDHPTAITLIDTHKKPLLFQVDVRIECLREMQEGKGFK